MLAPEAWASLSFIADPLCKRCGIPFSFEAGPDSVCGSCLADSPPFSAARAAIVYNDASRDFILKFKHADRMESVHSFLPWLLRAGGELLENADILVPVPLHRFRLLKRRYNQSALIALALARASGMACMPDALVRVRSTPGQGHLNFGERQKNVRKAFKPNARHAEKIKGARILLVDDVLTTGATVSECAKTLLRSGAARVDVLALARVVKSGVI